MSYPVLRIKGATVLRGSRTVMEDIDLDIVSGEILCLTGPNGSGKSTLLETLAGLHAPRSGEVVMPLPDQQSIPIRDSRGRRTPVPGLSIALQTDGACLDETVIERLKTASMVAGKSLADETIHAAMEKWALSHRSEDRLAVLSQGLRKRVSILAAILPAMQSSESRIILLDEPSEGLDSASRNLLHDSIFSLKEKGHSIVIATHDEAIIEISDRTAEISSGMISVSGSSHSVGDPPFTDATPTGSAVSALGRWILALEMRNPVDTVQRIVPALLAIFLLHSIGLDAISDGAPSSLAFYILVPALIAILVRPALIDRLKERRSGDWWRAHLGRSIRPLSSIVGSPWLLPIPLTYLSFIVLSNSSPDIDPSAYAWLWLPALSMLDIGAAATAIHMLVSGFERSTAVAASLMMAILVWPFLMLVDATTEILYEGMNFDIGFDTPLGLIICSSLIAALVWGAAVIIPDE
ncbi:MAG: ATP-binding cassette domain-containing protein [Candidatus Thermoplasmatota archaeon]|nr:ATP-binding cassette domain-containing protein [Candidatus Thermoplasmatota archaeon]